MSHPPHLPPIEPTRSTRARQPYLTESEFRDHFTSEGRRRVEQNLDSNVRAASSSSYSNRTPAQQSLYDWAAYNADSDSDSAGEQIPYQSAPYSHRQSDEVHENRRRNLPWLEDHRALRSQAQRDLEPREEPSGRITLPSVEHLRRSVQDLPEILGHHPSSERAPAPRSPSVTAALSRLIERQRLERRERPWERREWPGTVSYREPRPYQDLESITDEERTRLRQHLSELRRRERAGDLEGNADEAGAQVRRRILDFRRRERLMQRMDKPRLQKPSMPKTVNMLKYVSGLRSCLDQEDVINLSTDLGLVEEDWFSRTRSADLFQDVSALTSIQSSSFLAPGTIFTGVQQAPQELRASLLNRDRDYLRRMVATRNAANAVEDMADDVLVALGDSQISNAQSQESNAQRIQSRLERIRQSRQRNVSPQDQSQLAAIPPKQPPDSWPVSVTLHAVSLHPQNMTISGTMSASHIPDKLPIASPDHKPEGSSMSSFFEGEIVDFCHHTLETNPTGESIASNSRPRFPNCGIEVDARYWSGVGPFRIVAEERRRKKSEAVRSAKAGRDAVAETVGDIEREAEEIEREVDVAIAACLADRRWLERHVGGNGEWVLMRWKERCFISPSQRSSTTHITTSNPATDTNVLSASTTEYHQRHHPVATVNSLSIVDSRLATTASGCFGLTISGFYYVALHRQSGAIEGLYFDPGSQPFQELRLGVQGARSDESTEATSWMEPVGVKRCFPSVEFR